MASNELHARQLIGDEAQLLLKSHSEIEGAPIGTVFIAYGSLK